MAFGLDDPQKQRAALLIFLLLGGGYVFYAYLWSPVRAERVAVQERVATLEQFNDQARVLTQARRIKDLRRRETEYQVALATYEMMLPSEAEVATLLEDVARSALQYNVEIVNFAPLEPVIGEDLLELPYDVQVQGGYHDIGRFLASVASLPRLVRPAVISLQSVEVEAATDTEEAVHAVLATLRLSTFLPSGGGPVQETPIVEGDETSARSARHAAS
ncbi:MAG: type 4a pilus biogenesis protein PilO [Gemmatimonadota bacterium]